MAHIALYREWRPQRFADIVGQEHLTRTLQNALRTQRFAHAYLFNGPRGTGKTSAAKILARAINCEHGPTSEPCNECEVCRRILDGSNMDVREIDAASNRGVDEIRDIRDKIKMVPTEARYKVYIIDEVHMLTTEAFNALLKTLEEPPPHVMFILATTEPHKLPATVISRCQRFDFRRIMTRDIVGRLKTIAQQQGAEVEEEAFWIVARCAEGGMRDALSLFDQVLSLGATGVRTNDVEELIGSTSLKKLGELSEAVAKRDQREALLQVTHLLDLGKDPGQLLYEWTAYLRDILLFKTVPGLAEIQDRVQYDPGFPEIAEKFSTGRLAEILDQCGQTQAEFKWQNQGRLLLELLLVRLCRTQDDSLNGLRERIEGLERELEKLRNAPIQQIPALSNTVSAPNQPSSSTSHASPAAARAVPKASVPQAGKDVVAAQFAGWQLDENQARLKQVTSNWPRILERVKQIKIQTQAWLVNGDPVAVVPGAILVAFKNQIHQETCLKEMHKEIIEKGFEEILGAPYQLVGILSSKWDSLSVQATPSSPAEAPQVQADAAADSRQEVDKWIENVIETFGSDVVEILE